MTDAVEKLLHSVAMRRSVGEDGGRRAGDGAVVEDVGVAAVVRLRIANANATASSLSTAG